MEFVFELRGVAALADDVTGAEAAVHRKNIEKKMKNSLIEVKTLLY